MDKSPEEGGNPVPALLEGLHIACGMLDADGRVSYFSPDAERLTGFTRAEIIGRDMQLFTAGNPPISTARFLEAAKEGWRGSGQVRCADGTVRAVKMQAQPITLPDGAHGTLVIALDMEEAKRATTSLGMLDAFFHQSPFGFVILDEHLRYVMLNEALAELNERPVADHIGRHIREVFDSADIEAYEALLMRVLQTGETVLDLKLSGYATSSPGVGRVWAASWSRLINWRDVPLGLCGIIFDVTATEKATLDAARSRDRLQLLSQVGARQGDILDIENVVQNIVGLLAGEYCDLAAIDVLEEVMTGEPMPVDPDESNLVRRLAGAVDERTPGAAKLLEESSAFREAGGSRAFARVLATGQAELIQGPQPADFPGVEGEPGLMEAARAVDPRSVIITPLRARGVLIGSLSCIRFGHREIFDADDLLLVQEIADRTALTIDNSRLYRDEKQAALILQMSLLPDSLPEVPEAELEYRYLPNAASRQAGGDWYDVIQLPGRRLALVVGDVIGHGIQAAAAMGRYRTAVQSLALIGLEPSSLFTRLNEISMGFGDSAMASCLYVLYDPMQLQCTIACAGHPPPVIDVPGAGPRALGLVSDPMLGAIPGAEYRTVIVQTPAATRLLMYSDGVVESRRVPLDDGIANLTRQLFPRRSLADHCDRIMRATPPDARDDRTVLLAELHGLRRP